MHFVEFFSKHPKKSFWIDKKYLVALRYLKIITAPAQRTVLTSDNSPKVADIHDSQKIK